MTDLWEPAFQKNQMMWGEAPARSALFARDLFVKRGVKSVLVPGIGYGRNARPFLDAGMTVTGIEIAATAIALAREKLHLDIPIHHGSVTDMPFDDGLYDGVFCYGLLYLLDAPGRAKLIDDCWRQLRPGGVMVFSVIAKTAPQYGRGVRLGDDWYENPPGMRLYFYDDAAARRDFAGHGVVDVVAVDEPSGHGAALPFLNVVCARR